VVAPFLECKLYVVAINCVIGPQENLDNRANRGVKRSWISADESKRKTDTHSNSGFDVIVDRSCSERSEGNDERA